jgi:micrococcal nuclease
MYEYNAVIVKVVDGDTLDVLVDLGLEIFIKLRVRLYGIDTPEVYGVKHDSEEYAAGKKASDFVKKHLPQGAKVTIRTIKDKRGKYGRYLGKISFSSNGNKMDLSTLLLENGLAIIKSYD